VARLTLRLKVVRGGETVTADVVLPSPFADRLAFEAQFGLSAWALDDAHNQIFKVNEGADMRRIIHEEWLAFLAWRVLRRTTPELEGFAAFVDTIDELEVEELVVEGVTQGQVGTPDPTRRAAGSGRSRRSG
jgi:hypothetical protein